MKHEALKVWRRIDGHTQETMAELLEVTPRRYRDMENGEGCFSDPGELWLQAVRALDVRWNLTMLVGRLDEAERTIIAETLKPTHGWHVRAARIVRGVTQRELAARIEIDKSDLCRFERGQLLSSGCRKIYSNVAQGRLSAELVLAQIDVGIMLEVKP